jgi:hypothetical protein
MNHRSSVDTTFALFFGCSFSAREQEIEQLREHRMPVVPCEATMIAGPGPSDRAIRAPQSLRVPFSGIDARAAFVSVFIDRQNKSVVRQMARSAAADSLSSPCRTPPMTIVLGGSRLQAPFEPRVRAVALTPPDLVGVGEMARARVWVAQRLSAMDRYERRAPSRRKFAIRAFDVARSQPFARTLAIIGVINRHDRLRAIWFRAL